MLFRSTLETRRSSRRSEGSGTAPVRPTDGSAHGSPDVRRLVRTLREALKIHPSTFEEMATLLKISPEQVVTVLRALRRRQGRLLVSLRNGRSAWSWETEPAKSAQRRLLAPAVREAQTHTVESRMPESTPGQTSQGDPDHGNRANDRRRQTTS